MDVDAKKIEQLSGGDVPFFEPGLPELLRERPGLGPRCGSRTDPRRGRRRSATCTSSAWAPRRSRAATPPTSTALEAAIDGLAAAPGPAGAGRGQVDGPGRHGRSGWRSRLRALAPAGDGVELAWNPEFLREGFAVEDTLDPDRLVFGVESPRRPRPTLREVYAPMHRAGAPRWWSPTSPTPSWSRSPPTPSWPPRSRSSTRWPRCARPPAPTSRRSPRRSRTTRASAADFLQAGLGFGGGCLPKDIRAFMARAGELGVDQALTFLREVDAINQRRRARTVDLAREALGGSFDGRAVAVLGAAFKPDSDDVRDSPALDVAVTIHEQGGQRPRLRPEGHGQRRARVPAADVLARRAVDACEGADIVLHLTEWAEFRELDPAAARRGRGPPPRRRRPQRPRPERWRAAGWTYRALGRP